MASNHPGFTIGHRWHFNYRLVAIVLSILCIIFNFGQQIGVTLFLATFQDLTGVYFVTFFTAFSYGSVCCVVACWFAYKGQITPAMREWRWIRYMFYVSIFDAANALLTTSSSQGSRVPPALQAILSQILIPFTFIFSKWLLKKKYTWLHIFSVWLVIIGVAFSLVPTFKRMHDGTTDTTLKYGWYWPFIFILGTLPSAIKTIIQELLQVKFTEYAIERQEKITRYSVVYFQAVETTMQVTLIALCFALDFVPGFGTSDNIQEWWTSFSNGFLCFFNANAHPSSGDRCPAAAGIGVLFISCCLLASTIGTFLTDHISANWLAIVSSISPMLATAFWFIFPAINRWAGVGNIDVWDIGFSLGALPIIFFGMVFYESAGSDRRQSDEERPLLSSVERPTERPTELLW